jgi:4-hydroxy-2-oxoheptanedioate aldolase
MYMQVLHVPGVDVAFVGPFDLSFDLGLLDKHGYPKGMQTDDFQNVLTSIAAMCKASGVVAGCFASPAAGPKELIEMGFTMIGTGTDLALLDKAAAEQVQDLSAIRSTLGC